MRHYADQLQRKKDRVRYVEAMELQPTADIAPLMAKLGVTHVQWVGRCDDWLRRRLTDALAKIPIACDVSD